MTCSGKGKLKLSDLIEMDCLYSPDVVLNLISISQLTKKGCRISLNGKTCKVFHQDTEILNGTHKKGLWFFPIQEPVVLTTASQKEKLPRDGSKTICSVFKDFWSNVLHKTTRQGKEDKSVAKRQTGNILGIRRKP